MISESELAQLREDENALLPDTCIITRSSQGAFDANTGTYPDSPSTIYQGSCRIMPITDLSTRAQVIGERAVEVVLYQVTLPFDVPELKRDDIVTPTASLDPALVNRKLKVQSVTRSSLASSRRVVAEEVT